MSTTNPNPARSNENFLAAWKAAIALAGFRYFGDGTPAGCAIASNKNALRPRWEAIEAAFESDTMSQAEELFLTHLLTFFNSERGGWPVSKYLSALSNPSLGHASALLDQQRRAALADLLQTYAGW